MKRKNEEMVDNIAGSTSEKPLHSTTDICSIFAMPRPDDQYPEKPSSVLLTDPEILYCCNCSRFLIGIPVFQCENGHTACCYNCATVGDDDPICSSCLSPMDEDHNLMIEKVINSAKIPCQNRKFGCQKMVSFPGSYTHEKECTYAGFTCPFSGCNFESVLEQMSLHITTRHLATPILFCFDQKFDVKFEKDASFSVLQEEKEKHLFVLHRRCEPNKRTVFWLSRVPPVFEDDRNRFLYRFSDECVETGYFLNFETLTVDRGDVDKDGFPRSGYLILPPYNSGYVDVLKVSIRDDN